MASSIDAPPDFPAASPAPSMAPESADVSDDPAPSIEGMTWTKALATVTPDAMAAPPYPVFR